MDAERPRLRELEVIPYDAEGRPAVCLRDPEGISDHMAALPMELARFLLEVLDGQHTIDQIRGEFRKRSGGVALPEDELRAMIGQLDEALLLDSPRYRRRHGEVLAEYRAQPARPPVSAGSSYPAEPAELRAFLDGLVDGMPGPAPAGAWQAVAVPHLDLRYGGRVAAAALANAAASFTGDTVVVFGVGHQLGRLPYALTELAFETPLGTTPTHRELVARLVDQAGSWLLSEELVHKNEHSVEFAVLLLQHFLPDRDIRILPVLCGSFHQFLAEGRDPRSDALVDVFLETLAEEAGDALFLASVDLAHMGPFYGDREPLTAADLDRIEREDRRMLDRMADRDAAGFFRHLQACRDERRVCGASALYTTLSLLPAGGAGHLVTYEQPAFPEAGNTVSICSMTWTAG